METLQYLLENDVDVSKCNQANTSVLHWSVYSENPVLVRFLVNTVGLDSNIRNSNDETVRAIFIIFLFLIIIIYAIAESSPASTLVGRVAEDQYNSCTSGTRR